MLASSSTVTSSAQDDSATDAARSTPLTLLLSHVGIGAQMLLVMQDAAGTVATYTTVIDSSEVECIQFSVQNGASLVTALTLTPTTTTMESVVFMDENGGISSDTDTDLLTLANSKLTAAGELESSSPDVNGGADVSGTLTLCRGAMS